jgi:leucyl-tRNA synthetase
MATPEKETVAPDSAEERYDPRAIERKWQLVWDAENTWVVPNPGAPEFDESKPKSYVLEMLPYPSGEPHVGHLKTYSVGDAIAHFRRRRGYRVVHPMG